MPSMSSNHGGGRGDGYDSGNDGHVPHWVHYAHNRPHHFRTRMYQVGTMGGGCGFDSGYDGHVPLWVHYAHNRPHHCMNRICSKIIAQR